MLIKELLEQTKMKDGDEPFSYQEWVGVKINKVRFTRELFSKNPSGKDGHFLYLTPSQKTAVQKRAESGWHPVNGYEASGKEFADPDDNKSGTSFNRNIVILTKVGEPGALAVLPSGQTQTLKSKSWVPELKDFKN